jgi:hypothetical protein
VPQSVTSQQSILTYSTLYSTTTITGFVTVTAVPVTPKVKVKRDGETIKPIPAYATACSGVASYSSACSCWGITATTTTVFNSVSFQACLRQCPELMKCLQVSTVTVSSTVTMSGSTTSSTNPTGPSKPTPGEFIVR